MEDLLDKIEKIQAMSLKDGDIILVTVDENFTETMKEQIIISLNKFFKEQGLDIAIIMKQNDVEIEIIRKEDI